MGDYKGVFKGVIVLYVLVNWASIKGPDWVTPCYTHPPRTVQFASRDDTRNAVREYDSGRRSMRESSLDLG